MTPAERAWQPIETAPRDGSRILVYRPMAGICLAVWHSYFDGLRPHDAGTFGDDFPTHWMPLPEPPR